MKKGIYTGLIILSVLICIISVGLIAFNAMGDEGIVDMTQLKEKLGGSGVVVAESVEKEETDIREENEITTTESEKIGAVD